MGASGILDMLSSGDFSGLMGMFKGKDKAAASVPETKGPDFAGIAARGMQSMQQPPPAAAPTATLTPGRLGTVVPSYGTSGDGRGLQALLAPVRMAKGGPTPNDKQITSAAVAAIQGQHPNPQMAMALYLKKFGPAKLRELVSHVKSGAPMQQAGKVTGPGDGMSDNVPARGPGQDILLADGEYIVPADVVSGLGNGSTDAGARRLKEMEAKVRQERTGGTAQPPAMDPSKALPA